MMHDYARDSRVLDIPVLEGMQFDYLRSGFDPVWDKDPYRLFVYTTLQERATQESHSNTGKLAGSVEPVIGTVLTNVAQEEARHYSFYRTIFGGPGPGPQSRPGLGGGSDAVDRHAGRQHAAVPRDGGRASAGRHYEPRDYLAIVEEQIKFWAIEALDDLDEMGKRAQAKILRFRPG